MTKARSSCSPTSTMNHTATPPVQDTKEIMATENGLKTHRIGIIMNGVTGRMGMNQHLMRSILPIIREGGVKISENEVIMPDPILVGRNEVKLKKLSEETGIEKWSTDLDSLLEDDSYQKI